MIIKEPFLKNIKLKGIDNGIEREVMILRENGIETYESCEGGCRLAWLEGKNGVLEPVWHGSSGHVFPEPTVRFSGTAGSGFKAYSIAQENGLHVDNLRRFYSVVDGELVGPKWEMTFRKS